MRSFADEQFPEADVKRFAEISIPGYERIGAPRVGQDDAADKWVIQARQAKTPEEIAAVLKELNGYYAVALVDCDGVPKYSNAGMYDGVDETSFRGAFLSDCTDVLAKDILHDAWNHKLPEQSVAYGRALLAAADSPISDGKKQPRLLARLGLKKELEPLPLSEQLEIVRAAGRWFIFWGERGHAIRAYF